MQESKLAHLLEYKIIAIIRGALPDEMIRIADALYAGGVRSMEVTMNSPSALRAIENLASARGDQMLIGAGTVLDAATARAALLAGAGFIVSPTLDVATIEMTKRYGAASIPGAMTPTEILTAYTAGGDIIKVFPASVGAAFFKEMSGPLPQIPLMPTGGVNLDNIQSFAKSGAKAFGLGSSLTDTRKPVNDEMLADLTERAKSFIQAIHSNDEDQ